MLQSKPWCKKGRNIERIKEDKNPEARAGWWWHMTLTPALGRQKQVDLCKFEASLTYKS